MDVLFGALLSLCLQYQAWDCDLNMRAAHLKKLVVQPTLRRLAAFDVRLDTESSIVLMMGIAAQESDLWYNLEQLGGGPALGGYGVEPNTHADVWRYLNRPDKQYLREIVLGLVPDEAVRIDEDGNYSVDDQQLVVNMAYSTAIARIRLWYEPALLPPPDDIDAMAEYWDKHYNANPHAGFPVEFVKKYNRLVTGK